MAYNTVTGVSQQTTPQLTNDQEKHIITIKKEKDFLLNNIFYNDVKNFEAVNTYCNIYNNGLDDEFIPLTSVIYTPNKRFFEKSIFFNLINNAAVLPWLRKRNILVLVYGLTSQLDNSIKSQDTYNESILINNIMHTNGCIVSPHISIPTIFKSESDVPSATEDMVNLLRFEDSSFNFRLNTINDRIRNVYGCNFTSINYLIFHDLNNNNCISKFMKNIINVSLI